MRNASPSAIAISRHRDACVRPCGDVDDLLQRLAGQIGHLQLERLAAGAGNTVGRWTEILARDGRGIVPRAAGEGNVQDRRKVQAGVGGCRTRRHDKSQSNTNCKQLPVHGFPLCMST